MFCFLKNKTVRVPKVLVRISRYIFVHFVLTILLSGEIFLFKSDLQQRIKSTWLVSSLMFW